MIRLPLGRDTTRGTRNQSLIPYPLNFFDLRQAMNGMGSASTTLYALGRVFCVKPP
jgi:hypothetical protein